MLIILRSGATQEHIDHVVERIEKLGLRAHISKGEFRTIIGAIGEEQIGFPEQMLSIEGVENVLPIMKTYKLASREFHRDD